MLKAFAKLLLALGLFIAIIVAGIKYETDKEESDRLRHAAAQYNPPPGTPEDTATRSRSSAPALVNLDELVKAYDKNEVAADNQYGKKRFRFLGRIRNIGKDLTGDPYLTFGQMFKGVNCYFDEAHAGAIAKLSKGEAIAAEGECHGLTMGSVIMRDCSLISEAQIRADYPDFAKQIDDSRKKQKRRRAADDDE